MSIDWTHQLAEQLDRHWRRQLRPRYEGLTDAEYFWEPVANCWNIRPRGQGRAAMAAGGGEFVIDYADPEPSPAPVTTIAWRLAHLITGVFGSRVADHFGGPPVDYQRFHYAGTAAQALGQLDEVYAAWLAGVTSLDDAGLARPALLCLDERDQLSPVFDHRILAGKLLPQRALHLRLTDQQHVPAMIPVRGELCRAEQSAFAVDGSVRDPVPGRKRLQVEPALLEEFRRQ